MRVLPIPIPRRLSRRFGFVMQTCKTFLLLYCSSTVQVALVIKKVLDSERKGCHSMSRAGGGEEETEKKKAIFAVRESS